MARAIKAESLIKEKEFYFDNDINRGRKIIITSEGEIGYIYEHGLVKAYDGTIISESKIHPMKACRLLKEYWISTAEKRETAQQKEFEEADRIWLEEPLIKIMASDYKAKHENFDIYEFKKWFRRNLFDYEDRFPELV